MKTLTSSSSKIVVEKGRDKGFSSSREIFSFNRPEICFLQSKKLDKFGFFLHLISVQHKPIRPVYSLSPETQADLESAAQNHETYQSKTVHVKFQLQKECSFGEHFFIVGDDPMFGLWDPTSAIPLNWSEEHVWTVELDIPEGKSIQYKFILKGSTGNILWQPGPDRIFQTWETNNTITVSEDWENAEYQKIVEENPLANGNEEPTINSKKLIVAENLAYSEEEVASNVCKDPTVADNIAPSQEKPMAIVAENISHPKDDPMMNASDNVHAEKRISYPKEEGEYVVVSNNDMMIAEDILGYSGSVATFENRASTDVERNLIALEGDPVLVPGLIPLSTSENEETQDRDEKSIAFDASVGINEAKNYNLPELDEMQELDDVPHQEKTTEMFNDEKKQLDNELKWPRLDEEEKQPHSKAFGSNFLRNDIHWGRKTLQKLLTNLGLL